MQNQSNHRKFYAPHHFVFYPVTLLLMVITAKMALRSTGEFQILSWIAFAGIFLTTFLSFMMRQHYALKLQDRIIRNEVRLRYFTATGKSFAPLEEQLSFKQIAALRFAGDDEFVQLVNRAVSEKTDPANIKKSIKNWTPDNNRV